MADDDGRFIRRENVKHYRDLLTRTTEVPDRKRIQKLLAEEQEKQVIAGDPADCK